MNTGNRQPGAVRVFDPRRALKDADEFRVPPEDLRNARKGDDANELAATLSALEVNDMLAPFRALADNIRAKAQAAANNMAAQVAHLRETAESMETDIRLLLDKAEVHAQGIVSIAQDMQTADQRCRTAIALIEQAKTGQGVSD